MSTPSAPSSGPRGPRSATDVAEVLLPFNRNDVTRALAPFARAIMELSTKEAAVFDDAIVQPYVDEKTLIDARVKRSKPVEPELQARFELARLTRDCVVDAFIGELGGVEKDLKEVVGSILQGQVDGILTASGLMITGDLRETILRLPEYAEAARVLRDSITGYGDQRVKNTRERLDAACGDMEEEPATVDFGKAWDDLKKAFVEQAGTVHALAKARISEKISVDETASYEEAERVEAERVEGERLESERAEVEARERNLVTALNTTLLEAVAEFYVDSIQSEAGRRLDGSDLGSIKKGDSETLFFEAASVLFESRTGRNYHASYDSTTIFNKEVPADALAKQAAEKAVEALVAVTQLERHDPSLPVPSPEQRAAKGLFHVRRTEALRIYRQALLQRTSNGLGSSLDALEDAKLQALLTEAVTATEGSDLGNGTEVEVYADLVRAIVASVGGTGVGPDMTRSLGTISQLIGQIGPKLAGLRGEVREDNENARAEIINGLVDAVLRVNSLAALDPRHSGTSGTGTPIDVDALAQKIIAAMPANSGIDVDALTAAVSAQVGAQNSPDASARAILAQLKEAGVVVEPKKPGLAGRLLRGALVAGGLATAWAAGDKFDLPDMPEVTWPSSTSSSSGEVVAPVDVPAAPEAPAPAEVAVAPVAPVVQSTSAWVKISDNAYADDNTWYEAVKAATGVASPEGAFAVHCKDGVNGKTSDMGVVAFHYRAKEGFPIGADKWDTKGADLKGYEPFPLNVTDLCAKERNGSFGTVLSADPIGG